MYPILPLHSCVGNYFPQPFGLSFQVAGIPLGFHIFYERNIVILAKGACIIVFNEKPGLLFPDLLLIRPCNIGGHKHILILLTQYVVHPLINVNSPQRAAVGCLSLSVGVNPRHIQPIWRTAYGKFIHHYRGVLQVPRLQREM